MKELGDQMKNILHEYTLKKRLLDVENYLNDYLTFEPEFISENTLHNFRAGGKRLRPAFLILVAEYFKKYDKNILQASAMMELIHMSSLIHDDINDNSFLRRGEETLNAKFNNEIAINIGDYILIKALRDIYNIDHYERILSIVVDTAIEMAKGEIAQLESRYDYQQNMDTYLYRVERKTAILIAASCQIGAILAGASKEEEQLFYNYGYNVGMAFQMKDDLMDILDTKIKLGKPTGKDLENGLINLPTILLLKKTFPEKQRVIDLINHKLLDDQDDVSYIVNIIKRENCILDSEKIIFDYINRAKNNLVNLTKNPSIISLMKEGADYIYEREY